MIVPALVFGVTRAGPIMRIMRSALLDVLRQEYIRTAWSKGLGERTIVLRHALKNAMIPVISLIGLQMPLYIGGSVIIEAIFRLPGVGLFFFEALTRLDYPVVQSVNLIIAAMVVGLNLLIDLSYAFLDPRIRYRSGQVGAPPSRSRSDGRRRAGTAGRGPGTPTSGSRCCGASRSAPSAASSWSSCSPPRCSRTWITPYGFAQTSLRERFIAMNGAHWLGTDQLGRDLLTRLIYGARISLYVGFGAVAIGSVLATAIGVLSRLLRRPRRPVVQRGVDAWMAFPPLLLLMSIMSLLGPSVWNITIVLGVAFGIQNSRIVRGVALSIKEHTFVESARALGAGHLRTTVTPHPAQRAADDHRGRDHGPLDGHPDRGEPVVPGLGVPPPYPTWGGMLSLAGLDHMYQAPWLAIWPAVALSLAVFGFNMLGDALRDLLDPRLKGG